MKSRYYLILATFIFLLASFFINRMVPLNDSYEDIDSQAYIGYAKKFCSGLPIFLGKDKAAPYFSLGYAFFVGGIYKLFGINNNAVVLIQILLALILIFFIFKITNILFGNFVANLSVIISSLNVGFLTFSQFILTEILLALFLVVFLYCFIFFLKFNDIFYLFLSGFFLGGSIFIKPAAIYFVFPIIFFLLFFSTGKCFFRIKLISYFCLAFYIPIFGYMLFNKANFGSFQVSTLGNENLYFYLFPKVLAEINGSNFKVEHDRLSILISGSKLNPNSWKTIKKLFVKTLLNHPEVFVKIWIKNVLKTCFGIFSTNLKVLLGSNVNGGDISFFKTRGSLFERIFEYIFSGTNFIFVKMVSFLESIWTLLRYFFCVLALMFLMKKRNWKIFFFFIFYIFYFSMITGHDGCARFRMMFEPALIVLSAYGMGLFLKSLQKRLVL